MKKKWVLGVVVKQFQCFKNVSGLFFFRLGRKFENHDICDREKYVCMCGVQIEGNENKIENLKNFTY